MIYFDELTAAMTYLAQDEKTIFLGQSVGFSGNCIYKSLVNVPDSKRVEFPVAEELQMGISIGLSLDGFIPISIYPRMDFLILALNQLVNHLDKIKTISCGRFNPKVIIRTAIGSVVPLDPGLQHCSDYTKGLRSMLREVNVVKLIDSDQIIPGYKKALSSSSSTVLIEQADLY